MTHEIAKHLEAVGSEIEHSLATADEHAELADTLRTLAEYVQNIGAAKVCRIHGRINAATNHERAAEHCYKALPKEVQW